MVHFEETGGKRDVLYAGEVAELQDLFDLFWEKPLEVHGFYFKNIFNYIL